MLKAKEQSNSFTYLPHDVPAEMEGQMLVSCIKEQDGVIFIEDARDYQIKAAGIAKGIYQP